MTPEQILEIAGHYAVKNAMDRYLTGVDGTFTGETEIVTYWNFSKNEKLLAFAKAVIEADRQSSDEPVAYLWKSHFRETGKPIKLWLDRPEWPPGLGSSIPIVPVYTRPSHARKPLSDDEIEKEFDRRCELDCCPDFSEAVRWAEKMHDIGETE